MTRHDQHERLIRFAIGDLTEDEANELQRSILPDSRDAAFVHRIQQIISQLRHTRSAPADAIQNAQALLGSVSLGAAWTNWLASARQAIMNLTFDSRQTPALAGFRSGTSDVLLTFESNEQRVDLQIKRAAASQDQRTVCGQHVSSDPATRPGIGAAMDRHAGKTQTFVVESDGFFEFQTETGTFDLIFPSDDVDAATVIRELVVA